MTILVIHVQTAFNYTNKVTFCDHSFLGHILFYYTYRFLYFLQKCHKNRWLIFESFVPHSKCIFVQMDIELQSQNCTFTIWTKRSMAGDTMFSFLHQYKECLLKCHPSIIFVTRETGSKGLFM